MIRSVRFWLTTAAVAAMVVGCGGTAADTSPNSDDNVHVAATTGTVHAYENGYQDRVRMATDTRVTVSNYPEIVGSWDGGKWVLTEVPTDATEICAHLDDVSNCSAVTVTPDTTVEVTLNLGSESPPTSEPTAPEYEVVMSNATAYEVSPDYPMEVYENVEMRLWPDGSFTFTSDSKYELLAEGCTPGKNELIDDGDFDCQFDIDSPASAWFVDEDFVVDVYFYNVSKQELDDEPYYTITVTEHPLAE